MQKDCLPYRLRTLLCPLVRIDIVCTNVIIRVQELHRDLPARMLDQEVSL